jgi:hypothetical protein
MPQPRAHTVTPRDVIHHWMIGSALGVICAGVLLVTGSLQANHVEVPEPGLETIRFLLSIGFVFGFGSALTGVMFLATEIKRNN